MGSAVDIARVHFAPDSCCTADMRSEPDTRYADTANDLGIRFAAASDFDTGTGTSSQADATLARPEKSHSAADDIVPAVAAVAIRSQTLIACLQYRRHVRSNPRSRVVGVASLAAQMIDDPICPFPSLRCHLPLFCSAL